MDVLACRRTRRSGRRGPSGPALLLVLFGVAPHLAAAGSLEEYEVKAAFLYNFAKFVEWPDGSLESRERFTICVIGASGVSEQLERVVSGRNVDGLSVAVRTLKGPGADDGCQILFATGAGAGEAVVELGVPGVLTVGESATFARNGGMINFVFVENKVRFEINRKSAEKAGLAISSKLLKLAHDVFE